MEAPKCKICGDRHYGLCAGPARQSHPPPTTIAPEAQAQRPPNVIAGLPPISGRGVYAITTESDPHIVKIGQTTNWKQRITYYSRPREAMLFAIPKDVSLRVVEGACLLAMGIPPCSGKEWFASTIGHAQETITRVLNAMGVPFTVSPFHRNASPRYEDEPIFDRKTYMREYMRKRRAGEITPKVKETPEEKAAREREYMRNYMRSYRAKSADGA